MTTTVVDLHIHSQHSDGQHTPAELVTMARGQGLRAIAICDHDTVSGVQEAASAARGTDLEVLSGVEISVDADGWEVHILGYLVDPTCPELVEALARSRESRRERAQHVLARLRALGVSLSWDRVQELARKGAIGRPHIALAMEEAHYVATIQEAFDRYLGRGRPAYVSREKMTTRRAIELIGRAGGIPVLAHPWVNSNLLPELASLGLLGLEVYYFGYTRNMVDHLVGLAQREGLVCTGGSDYHGPDVWPDNHLGGVPVPWTCVQELRALERENCLTRD